MAILLSVLGVAGSVGAAPASLEAGVAAYEAAEYERAVALLHEAFTESLTQAEQATVLRTLAFAHVALDQADQARAEFKLLLRIDPRVTLDDTISPRTRLVFEEARSELAPAGPSPIAATLVPPQPSSGRPLTVSTSAPGVARALLHYRAAGQPAFQLASAVAHDGRVAIEVPGMHVSAPSLEYYLEGFDAEGVIAARSGDADRPVRIDVLAAQPKKPLYRRGWLWGTVAGVTAAAVLIGVLAGIYAEPSTVRLAVAHP
jgi:hypothetical protein